ncbi:MAG: hypothetical protein HZA03_00755 [Nitrospinae bacterium]|nr:hypothetical protein [Nitrospinota bacterium]
MGNLRDQIFYRAINDSLDRLRNEMCLKYKPKKENRFFVNWITYELGVGRLTPEGVMFEISSKIPNEFLPVKGGNARYFKEVRDIMMKAFKKPHDVKMENIVRSLNINELKERDYVKCAYLFKNEELYTEEDIDKIIRAVNAGKMELPDTPGITTLGGKAVIYRMQESIYGAAVRLVAEFIKANNMAIKKFAEMAKTMKAAAKKPAAKKAAKKAPAKKAPAKKAPPKAKAAKKGARKK